MEDSEAGWHTFFESKLEFYRRFTQKWIVPGESDTRIILRYEHAVNNPVGTLKKVISFFFPHRALDDSRIRSVASRFTLRRDMTSFRYYNDALNDRVNRLS